MKPYVKERENVNNAAECKFHTTLYNLDKVFRADDDTDLLSMMMMMM